MEEAFTFGAAAPFIVLIVAMVRVALPEVKGRVVPLLVMALTVLWGGVLSLEGLFTAGLAEFVVTAVMTATAAVGMESAGSTFLKAARRHEDLTE